MIDLLSAAGDRLLAEALRGKPLLALDFDGTLSPLVPIPDDAAIDPRMPGLLEPLMARMPVAIVSGRGLDDLRERVPLSNVTLVGNHGNEWLPAAGQEPVAGLESERGVRLRQICRDWAQALTEPIAALGPGLAFETKTVSLSIHYRLADDPPRMRERLLDLVGRLKPAPEIIEGKFVINLMAPGLVTKFEAVVELLARHHAVSAIFVGDDVTDERVFERAPEGWLTVRVRDEEAAGTTSAARSFVQGVDGVAQLLERLEAMTRNL